MGVALSGWTPAAAPVAPTNSRGRAPEVKLARRIADQLETDILASGVPIGQVYASETDLRKRYGASRAVVREAIRLVEHHGLAQMRRGPAGGLILQAPDARPLTTAVVIYLEYVGTTVEDLLSVRLLLEPFAAGLAAQNLDENGVAALRATLTEELGDADAATRGRDLHVFLGASAGNKVLGLFIDVLVQLTDRYTALPDRAPNPALDSLAAGAHDIHQRIVQAVIGGNGMRAEQYMTEHIESMRDWFAVAGQQPIRRRAGTSLPASAAESKQKLAEAVARAIMAGITDGDEQPGDVHGSEAQLIERFGVSRAVFREAVRLLEYHSIARMRRGPYGGLVVSQPDPTASIDAMAVYLDYERVGADQLREVRNILELGAVDRVVERLPNPEILTALRGGHCVDHATPARQLRRLSHGFHLTIAELAGNPLLDLFLRIVVALWERHSAHPVLPTAESAAISTTVGLAHDRILDAILAGDRALARHRMNRHLEALDSWWE